MGREVRMVPPNWVHPRDDSGEYSPLLDNYAAALEDFEVDIERLGLKGAIDYWRGGPCSYDYMLPDEPPENRTHYMMYESTSEGTPISPPFETPERLAKWLADNKASSFADFTASYEEWLRVVRGGYAPSLMYSPKTGLISGVEAMGTRGDD